MASSGLPAAMSSSACRAQHPRPIIGREVRHAAEFGEQFERQIVARMGRREVRLDDELGQTHAALAIRSGRRSRPGHVRSPAAP